MGLEKIRKILSTVNRQPIDTSRHNKKNNEIEWCFTIMELHFDNVLKVS